MENITKYLEENIEVAKEVARELNGWNGSLEFLDVHYNDEDFFNTFFAGNVQEAVRAVSFGDYDYNEEFVRFNGLGNLETLSEYEYTEEVKDYIGEIVESLLDNYSNIYTNDELTDLLTEYEESL